MMDVSTEEGFNTILRGLSSIHSDYPTSCTFNSTEYGGHLKVPNFAKTSNGANTWCALPTANRSHIDCDINAMPDAQRLCWCPGETIRYESPIYLHNLFQAWGDTRLYMDTYGGSPAGGYGVEGVTSPTRDGLTGTFTLHPSLRNTRGTGPISIGDTLYIRSEYIGSVGVKTWLRTWGGSAQVGGLGVMTDPTIPAPSPTPAQWVVHSYHDAKPVGSPVVEGDLIELFNTYDDGTGGRWLETYGGGSASDHLGVEASPTRNRGSGNSNVWEILLPA
jgi:hypothetical protein